MLPIFALTAATSKLLPSQRYRFVGWDNFSFRHLPLQFKLPFNWTPHQRPPVFQDIGFWDWKVPTAALEIVTSLLSISTEQFYDSNEFPPPSLLPFSNPGLFPGLRDLDTASQLLLFAFSKTSAFFSFFRNDQLPNIQGPVHCSGYTYRDKDWSLWSYYIEIGYQWTVLVLLEGKASLKSGLHLGF